MPVLRGGRARVAAGVGATTIVVAAALAMVIARDDDAPASHTIEGCVRRTPEDWSVARSWNEALLAAIRLDVPAPTVHSRNLFHTSAAMWDAWAGYDATAAGVFVDEEAQADDVAAARDEAISYAAYGVLVERYLLSAGAEKAVTGFDQLMDDLCFDRSFVGTDDGSPAAFGNHIAATILATTLGDGSNEADRYRNPDYQPVNAPLVVAMPGTEMVDPNRWQPLELEVMVAQNGLPLNQTVQTFIGSQWGNVTPFALPACAGNAPALDPGPPPRLGDPATDLEFKDEVVEVIAHSASLDPADATTLDVSPTSQGNSAIDSYDMAGHDVNPVTGEPYEPQIVRLGDYTRAVTEFWADGPTSETPPGHWNVIANSVADSRRGDLSLGGTGPAVDPLEWDVKMYLALNGAMHDAAIAAWGAKAFYDSARPISMIRYMGGLGQSSDPAGPSYDPAGLPLVPGLVEVVTAESAAPGARHEALAEHLGEMAIRAWAGSPSDPANQTGGVRWILAVDWVPYQRPTFVTPAFPGYVSGHSTFSRAGAGILERMTGSEYFPTGLASWTTPAGSLHVEAGPTTDVTLEWATYNDAADQAGRSRLYGGIHVRADDLAGREIGAAVAQGAWDLAQHYFLGETGTIPAANETSGC